MSDEKATPVTQPTVTDVAGGLVEETGETTSESGTHNTPEIAPQIDAEPSGPAADNNAAEQPDTANPDDVKWRARYRQAETLLTIEQARTADLAERISTMQRQEVERLAAVTLEDPTDLWRDGTALADLLGDDGHVDADKVADAAHQTVEAHQHWRRAKSVVGAPASAVTSDGRIPSSTTTPTWAELLGGNKTG